MSSQSTLSCFGKIIPSIILKQILCIIVQTRPLSWAPASFLLSFSASIYAEITFQSVNCFSYVFYPPPLSFNQLFFNNILRFIFFHTILTCILCSLYSWEAPVAQSGECKKKTTRFSGTSWTDGNRSTVIPRFWMKWLKFTLRFKSRTSVNCLRLPAFKAKHFPSLFLLLFALI